jgi:DNA-binding MarR family transcriptional regulator
MGQAEIATILDNNPERLYSTKELIDLLGQSKALVRRNLRSLIKRREYYVVLQYKENYRFKGYVQLYGRVKNNGRKNQQ